MNLRNYKRFNGLLSEEVREICVAIVKKIYSFVTPS
jgi:hypothetical protein